MSELLGPSPDKYPPEFESVQDTAEYLETLHQINDRYLRLTLLDTEVSYIRTHSVYLADSDNPIIMSATTKSKADNLGTSTITVVFPTDQINYFGKVHYSEFMMYNHKGAIKGGMGAHRDSGMSSLKELGGWLERDDLPENMAAIISRIALIQMGIDKRDQEANVPLAEYKELWNAVQHEFDASIAPVNTVCEWRPDRTYQTSSGENVYTIYSQYIMQKGAGSQMQEAGIVTGQYEASIDAAKNGVYAYRFVDYMKLKAFPELTDEERANHPYVVVKAEDDTHHGSFSVRKAYADMYQDTTYFDTAKEAQEYADTIYKEELAHKRGEYALTPDRAARVLKTLDDLLIALEKRAQDK